jgi:rubrerythrin
MYEYVKRTDVVAEINQGDLLVGNCAEWAREIVWRTPYSDVVEVKHGRWIERNRTFGSCHHTTYTCSKCGCGAVQKTNYCPDCGANMNKRYWYEK